MQVDRSGTDRRRALFATLGCAWIPAPNALAQRASAPRVGWLGSGSHEWEAPAVTAVLDGLRQLGYTPGSDIVIEYRFANDDLARLDRLAVELVQSGVDAIIALWSVPALAARRATSTIPIVMALALDPVGKGQAETLARPGGNVTGLLAEPGGDSNAKPFEFLKELVPKLSHIGALRFGGGGYEEFEQYARRYGTVLGVKVSLFDLPRSGDLDPPFAAMRRQQVDGLLFWPGGESTRWNARVAQRALEGRLPSGSHHVRYALDGGLVAYGTNWLDNFRRVSAYIDKILKGAKAGDLPMEQPTRVELVVNRRTAAALGIALPGSIVVRADRLVD